MFQVLWVLREIKVALAQKAPQEKEGPEGKSKLVPLLSYSYSIYGIKSFGECNMQPNYSYTIHLTNFRGEGNGAKGVRGPKGEKGDKGEGPCVAPGPKRKLL